MPTFFIVRATISNPARRATFDQWYGREHLSDAVKSFGAQKAWRYWSETDPAVHFAQYQFSAGSAWLVPEPKFEKGHKTGLCDG